MTSDQGVNMKKAMTLYNEQITAITWIPCASHKIQICINNSLKRNSSVSFIFQRCKDIVVIFAGSSAATEILGLHQKILFDETKWKVLGFNKMRRNSWFIMAARVHKLMPAILASIRELEEGSKDLKDKQRHCAMWFSVMMRSTPLERCSLCCSQQRTSPTGRAPQRDQRSPTSMPAYTLCSLQLSHLQRLKHRLYTQV
jgi:hypothetical protein